MRLKLTLNCTTRHRMLPMDYQYYISAWIYNVLKQADSHFAIFLHDKGYGQSADKLYKLFCFSRLNFGKPKLWKERKLFEISVKDIWLDISFDVDDAATNFIKGLFKSKEFYLGDKFNGIDFIVTSVAVLPEPVFSKKMKYKLQTPWVISYKNDTERYPQYLSPINSNFEILAVKHLTEKYNSTRNTDSIDAAQIKFKRLTEFKRAGFLIKPNTPKQSRIIGSLFSFELTAPIEIHKMIWGAGVSEKSSNGFGWCNILSD